MSDDELDSAIDRAMTGRRVADANFTNFAPDPFLNSGATFFGQLRPVLCIEETPWSMLG